jgi:hypothetical protein
MATTFASTNDIFSVLACSWNGGKKGINEFQ